MKGKTFAELIFNNAGKFIKGYATGASSEGSAQVKLDPILKHRFEVPVAHPDMGGTKIRETKYPIMYSQESADFGFKYTRPVASTAMDDTSGTVTLKTTEYWIELKVQSGQTKQFSGMSWKKAFLSDIEKLQAVFKRRTSANNLSQGFLNTPQFNRLRCFVCLIAFDLGTIGKINAGIAGLGVQYNWISGTAQYEGQTYSILVLVHEMTG